MASGWLKPMRLLDLSGFAMEGEALLPFAVDEIECANVTGGMVPLLHLWRHRHALVLGLRDRKLPYAVEAMERFHREGWQTAVRSSGGAAVPLDGGVLNVSLILPNRPGIVNIEQDFALMAQLIINATSLLCADAPIRAGEIAGAYCPGEYDLAIDGYKFCGIAQRRKIGALIVQAFVVVEGSGGDRARSAAKFYKMAVDRSSEESARDGVTVTEQSTRSLQELLGRSVTVERFAEAIRTVATSGELPVKQEQDYRGYDNKLLAQTMETMKARYDTRS